jgi:serine protease Do
MTLKSLNVSLLKIMMIALSLFSVSAQAATNALPDFTQLIEKHSPAVVKIETVTRVRASQQPKVQIPDDVPEIFRQFFERRQAPQRNNKGMGSGFFISSDGYVLTNNHVVDGATEILVRLSDRREFDATIVGVDPQSDLALLKVTATGLPFLTLADSSKTRVGEWVLAIGSPFGLDYSVSAGIVSAIGRSIPSANQQNYVPFIQTDVAINPGNSGGPLFNLEGQVVGINSQIYTNSGGSIGLSFAIPANLASNVVEQLKKNGSVDRGWLGVVIQDVDKDLALSFGLKKPQGALIAQLDPNGPGKKSGLMVSDIILSFDGNAVQQSSDLPHIVGPIKPGTQVPAMVMRKGKKKTLSITIGSRTNPERVTSVTPEQAKVASRLGVVVLDLNEEQREFVGVDGVVIMEIDPESPAAKAGLQVGDVLVQLGFDDIASIKQFRKVEKRLSANKPLPVRVIRKGSPLFRSIVLEK